MSTLTVYAEKAGYIQSIDTSYQDARDGLGSFGISEISQTPENNSGLYFAGQMWDSGGFRVIITSYFSFDTSSLPDNASISNVEFSVLANFKEGAQNYDITCKLFSWGSSLTDADWRDCDLMSGDTTLATYDSSGGWNDSTRYTFTSSGSNFNNNISKTGSTQFYVTTSRVINNNTPTGDEYVVIYAPDQTGNANDPKLIITYTTPSTVSVSGSTGTLSGSISRRTSKSLLGTAGSLSASLFKRVPIRLSGVTGSLSGVISNIRAYVVDLSGTMGILTGSISRITIKALSGTLTGTGSIIRNGMPIRVSGGITSINGSIETIKVRLLSLAGSLSPTGALTASLREMKYAIMKAGRVVMNKIRGGSVT